MDWLGALDGYCERQSPAYWAEPVNALTNLAFLIAAAALGRRSPGLPLARALCGLLFAIGIGSFLFHTHANALTGTMDVAPILLFILVYIFAAARDFLGLKPWQALLCCAAFVPYAGVLGYLFGQIPGLGGSAAYAPVPVLILGFAVLARHTPQTARGLVIGAALLTLSLTFRTLDAPLCAALPLGTHFLWHILNAVMLGWMIAVYVSHRKEAG